MEIHNVGMSRDEWHYREYIAIGDYIDSLDVDYDNPEDVEMLEQLVDQMNIALKKYNFFNIKDRVELSNGKIDIDTPDFELDYYHEKESDVSLHHVGRILSHVSSVFDERQQP